MAIFTRDMRENGREPAGPLSDTDFAGLLMPQQVWDDEVSAP
jgi:hypothetical protein